jgi:hypothetical protein
MKSIQGATDSLQLSIGDTIDEEEAVHYRRDS